jgi:hypothetical protein
LALEFGTIEFNPSSADQAPEFIELRNPNSEDLDISGWTMSGGVSFTFVGGTVVPAGESIYLSPSTGAFRQRPSSPTGGEGRFVVGPYSGHLSNFGETLTLSDANGTVVAETTYQGDPSDPQRYLVVSELHYHPAGDPDSEFIELTNVSDTTTLDLTGVKFSAGIDFAFAGSAVTSLAPGEHVLVVRNIAAFEATYGTGQSSRIAGIFANGTVLSNSGERIKIDDLTNSTVRDFTYSDSDPWPVAADGTGPSLILRNPTSLPDHDDPLSWGTGRNNGTPGSNTPPFDFWLGDRGQSDPLADPNHDGYTELETYVLAGDLRPIHQAFSISQQAGDTILDIVRRDSSDALVALEFSGDLDAWHPGVDGTDYELLTDTPAGDGTRDTRLRLLPGTSGQTRKFFRLRTSVGE